MTESLCKATDDLGAEPLEGSGFDDEMPEDGFSEEAASEYSPRPSA
jgi:hypothetical protein